MGYFSVLKRNKLKKKKKTNELISHKNTWRTHKCTLFILLSKRGNFKMYNSNYMTSEKDKTIETVKRLVVAKGYGSEK